MCLRRFILQRSLFSQHVLLNTSRALQQQSYPTLNRKPRLDKIQIDESRLPYAEDVTAENQFEKLSDLILPLSNHSYDEQLKIKQNHVERSFDQIGAAILWDKRIDTRVLKYVEFQQGQFCHVNPISPSPLTEKYRCKDEVSSGYGVDGQKTVGFYLNPRDTRKSPRPLCIAPLHLKSMKPKHVLTIKHFDQFLKQYPLAVFESSNLSKKDQYWRTLTVKSNEQDELMMSVVLHPQSLSKIELDQVKADLRTYFVDGPGRECQVNSMYFQTCSQYRCTSDENPFELLHGDAFIYEMYNGKRFRISPDGFIQVNKQAAELVYRWAVEHAQLDENTILLDIGSTLGVYSVMASPLVKKVYAIDPLASCIEDGKFNAKLNDCRDNIEWICSFAEANLHRILKKIGDLHAGNTRIVAIINPSRYGLTNKTTATLRELSNLKQILYVLSKVDEQVMHNFYELAAGQRSMLKPTGGPLVPACVYPVDLLPHATQTELVVQCVRV